MNRKITINGKDFTLVQDSFGVLSINGVPIDQFIEQLPEEDIIWLAQYGMKTVQDKPEVFDDIAERIEMPRDLPPVNEKPDTVDIRGGDSNQAGASGKDGDD